LCWHDFCFYKLDGRLFCGEQKKWRDGKGDHEADECSELYIDVSGGFGVLLKISSVSRTD